MITKQCSNPKCSVIFKTPENRKKYCSRSCAASVNNLGVRRHGNAPIKKKSRLQQWIDGEWDGTVKDGLSSTIRTYLLEQARYRCTSNSCSTPNGWAGVNPKSGKSCLTVDHTDGDSQNNHPSNLKVLCPNCHSLTPTYGALNKGKGRKSRYTTQAPIA